MHVYCSTQHPTEMQHLVAHVLNVHSHNVLVECRRMGGGFGGKELPSGIFACCAALVAWKLLCPVKLGPDRDDDIMITGKRHDFVYEFEVGYDDEVKASFCRHDFALRLLRRPVGSGDDARRLLDNAYWLSDVKIDGYCGKTNTQSNTAFRGFGRPQGAFAIEYIMDNVARSVGRDSLDVRRANLYGKTENNKTPVRPDRRRHNVIHELIAELEETSEYRKQAPHGHQRIQREQRDSEEGSRADAGQIWYRVQRDALQSGGRAGSYLHRWFDARKSRRHGNGPGFEHEGRAGRRARTRRELRARARDRDGYEQGREYLSDGGLDRHRPEWKGCAGRRAPVARTPRQIRGGKIRRRRGDPDQVRFANDRVIVGDDAIPFGEIVQKAYLARVQLCGPAVSARRPSSTGIRRQCRAVRSSFYYSYGAVCSGVVIDTLTGEMRVDALHDVGASLNPALDIGQVEGAFVQGMGWLTTEELWWNDKSKLMTHAPSTYKIPTINDMPADFRVNLFKNRNAEDSIHARRRWASRRRCRSRCSSQCAMRCPPSAITR